MNKHWPCSSVPTIKNANFMAILLRSSALYWGGAKPGMDYGKLAATMPQITAMLDEVDHNLFRMSPLMFMVLIDMKGDSQNRANHLVITKEQRDSLVRKLEGYFGEALGKDKRYVASSALVMRDKLLEFKCSDDPWE